MSDCIGDHWYSENGQPVACAYRFSFQVVSTTRERHIIELPGEAIVRLFQLVSGPVGSAGARSYFAETGGHHYSVDIKPPDDASDYKYLTHSWRVSERGAKNWDNHNDPSNGHWQWELKKQAFGSGRSWFNAAWVVVYSHPSITNPNIEWCQNFCEVIVDRINAELHASIKGENAQWREETPDERRRREDRERDWNQL